MKKSLLILFLFTSLLSAQTLQLFWDLDNDSTKDVTYTCSDSDTITARLYMTYLDSTNLVADYPVYAFDIPVMYGYYTVRNSNPDYYSNILTLDSIAFDSTGLGIVTDSVGLVTDTNGVFNYYNNANLKRLDISYYDTTSHAILADSCIATFTFIVSGTGNQLLHFNYLGNENNFSVLYNTAVLNNKLVPYKLQVYDCKIISQ
jgi:hypothetical protein